MAFVHIPTELQRGKSKFAARALRGSFTDNDWNNQSYRIYLPT